LILEVVCTGKSWSSFACDQ